MKPWLLLLLLLTLNVAFAERPEIRRADERLLEISKLGSSHCSALGKYKAACEKDLDLKVMKRIKAINSAMVADYDNKAIGKINSDIREEKLVIKYRGLLDSLSVAYTPSEKSKDLKLKYEIAVKEALELECLVGVKEYVDATCGELVTYTPAESCKQIQDKLDKVNQCVPVQTQP